MNGPQKSSYLRLYKENKMGKVSYKQKSPFILHFTSFKRLGSLWFLNVNDFKKKKKKPHKILILNAHYWTHQSQYIILLIYKKSFTETLTYHVHIWTLASLVLTLTLKVLIFRLFFYYKSSIYLRKIK